MFKPEICALNFSDTAKPDASSDAELILKPVDNDLIVFASLLFTLFTPPCAPIAGDPAYTSNDRAMLQLEVDQLKQEIDRVSSSTEFNTKKLLNGDAAAL